MVTVVARRPSAAAFSGIIVIHIVIIIVIIVIIIIIIMIIIVMFTVSFKQCKFALSCHEKEAARDVHSEGGTMRLEALTELKLLNSSFSSFSRII